MPGTVATFLTWTDSKKKECNINLPKYYILNYTRMPTYNHIPAQPNLTVSASPRPSCYQPVLLLRDIFNSVTYWLLAGLFTSIEKRILSN